MPQSNRRKVYLINPRFQWRFIGFMAVVSLLAKKLGEHPLPDARRIAQLVANLDADKFSLREQAMVELGHLGDLAIPALTSALEGTPPVELKRRAEELLERLAGGGPGVARLAYLRTLEVLERIGSPEAGQVIARWARGPAEDWLTREAKAVLQRMTRPPAGEH